MAFEVEHGSAGPLSSSSSIRGFKNGRFATFSVGSNRVVAIGNPRPAPADGLDTGIPCLGTKSASGAAHASPGQRPRIRPSRNQPSPERARQPMVHAPMPGLAHPFRTPGVFWGAGTRVVAPRQHGHAPLGRRVLGRGAWVPCRASRPPTRCHSISITPLPRRNEVGSPQPPTQRFNLETAVEEDFKTGKGPSHPGGWAHGQEPKGSPCE